MSAGANRPDGLPLEGRGPVAVGTAQAAAQAMWPGMRVQWVDSVDSTNSELMRRLGRGDAGAYTLVADEQTAGRGRFGKPWSGQRGRAIAISVSVPLAPANWSGLSLVVGIALVSTLSEWARAQALPVLGNGRLGLKWPNDVWLVAPALSGARQGSAQPPVSGSKMCGILVETAHCAGLPVGAPRHVVVGMGVNLRPQQVREASVPAVSVEEWTGEAPSGQTLLDCLLPNVLAALQQFEAQGFAAFHSNFESWDLLHGQALVLSDGRQGLGLGVNGQGALLLASDDAVLEIGSGEVSVRPQFSNRALPAAGR